MLIRNDTRARMDAYIKAGRQPAIDKARDAGERITRYTQTPPLQTRVRLHTPANASDSSQGKETNPNQNDR
ncbi:hypothetical protein VTJ04DRAFT_7093 [Mycothermus thermophilus]|uniref:uncharacterized protein n=1 Tax=Humicola insolens TaxID=85995 RepID=UPI0037428B5E